MTTPVTTASAKPAPSPYIVSPWVDFLLIVGAVLVCPAVLLPAAHWSSPYTVWLVVMSFGAVGHHLPSFLRTYGDRELFRRFQTRLIIAPILLFALTLSFAVRGLHGMLLLSMCWSIWHGMMQHFGFLRIYDSKVRSTSPLTARLDWWMSACWFGLCLVLSPNQSGSLLGALYDSGVPVVPIELIGTLRVVMIVLTSAVSAVYINHAIRGNQPRSWMKLGLLIGTFVYVWIARVVTRNPYLSVALFEMLHDVQYLAVVWAFNRRLAEKGSAGVIPKFFYRPRMSAVAGYVGACLAYGALALTVYTQLHAGLFKQVMEAFLITSGLLHYYYDGFIWKLRQPETRKGLDLEGKTATYRPLWNGLGHAVLIGVPILLLARLELKGASADDLKKAESIASAVPENSTALNNLGAQLLQRGEIAEAAAHLRKALMLQPGLKEARESLSDALALMSQDSASAGRFDEALAHIREAVSLEPDSPDRLNSMAVLLAQAGRYDEAESGLKRAIQIDPTYQAARQNLEAVRQARRAR